MDKKKEGILDLHESMHLHFQNNAEVAVREMLKEIGEKSKASTGQSTLHAIDFMDDGSKIQLRVDIDVMCGEAVFDFTGSGPEVYGNINSPKAVVLSALIYSLRYIFQRLSATVKSFILFLSTGAW